MVQRNYETETFEGVDQQHFNHSFVDIRGLFVDRQLGAGHRIE
jgi:hypothetical protein